MTSKQVEAFRQEVHQRSPMIKIGVSPVVMMQSLDELKRVCFAAIEDARQRSIHNVIEQGLPSSLKEGFTYGYDAQGSFQTYTPSLNQSILVAVAFPKTNDTLIVESMKLNGFNHIDENENVNIFQITPKGSISEVKVH